MEKNISYSIPDGYDTDSNGKIKNPRPVRINVLSRLIVKISHCDLVFWNHFKIANELMAS